MENIKLTRTVKIIALTTVMCASAFIILSIVAIA